MRLRKRGRWLAPTNQPVTREDLISFSVRQDQVKANERRFSNDDSYQPPRSNNPYLIETVAKELVNNPAYQKAEKNAADARKDSDANPKSEFSRESASFYSAALDGVVHGYCAAKGVPQSEVNLVTRAVNFSASMEGTSREKFNEMNEKLERAEERSSLSLKFLEDGKSTPEMPTAKDSNPEAPAKPVPPR